MLSNNVHLLIYIYNVKYLYTFIKHIAHFTTPNFSVVVAKGCFLEFAMRDSNFINFMCLVITATTT